MRDDREHGDRRAVRSAAPGQGRRAAVGRARRRRARPPGGGVTRYLVTGGAGFIGSHLVEHLVAQAGSEVRVLDNFATGKRENLAPWLDRVELLEGSVVDLDVCRRACDGVDFVLHQAAVPSVPRSVAEPMVTHEANVTGTLTMLLAARDAEVRRFVYASSSSVYGDGATAAAPRRGGAAFGRFAGASAGGAGLRAHRGVARGPAADLRVAPGASEAGGVTGEDSLPDLWFGRLGRNLWFSAVSFGLRIGVHVLLIVLTARVLSTEAFGQYTLAIALGSICVVLCDYGFNFLVTREIARDRAAAATLLPSGALAKGALSLAALALLGVTLALLGDTGRVVAASVIITLSFAANSYGTYLTAAFKGLQRFDAETLSYVGLYGVLFVSQAIVLWLAPSPVNLALCFLGARLVYLVVCVALYARVVGVSWARPSPGEAWRVVVQCSAFALDALSAALALQLGTVLLSYFSGEAAVGEFQQALRFGMAAAIPLAIAEDVFYAFLADVRARAADQFARRLVLLNKVGG